MAVTQDDDALEEGRKLFAQECRFVTGAAASGDIPPGDYPEVAFVGRSNVGKSSLINALTGRNALARVSNTPGRTRQINFFLLGDRLILADLPGYGYARVSKAESARWKELIGIYLRGRPNLRRVFLLIDARHGLKETDLAVMRLMDEAAVSYQLILTKADKCAKTALDAVLAATATVAKRHTAAHPELLATSAIKDTGIGPLRAHLAAFVARAPAPARTGR